jgi:3-phenylpropionate/trans-cinnamate dioxygenase ferredoxin reductase subunit
VEQARVAAAHICGKETQHAHTPWFWSDQFDIKLQSAGLCQGFDRLVVRGDVAQNHFSVWYFHEHVLLAVDAINKPGDFILGKRWITESKHPDPDRVGDTGVDLKSLVA